MLNPATTQSIQSFQRNALPSRQSGEVFLSAIEASAAVRWGTWKSHVNHALMAGARPENAGSSDLAERCFDTFVDQLWAVLQEEGLLPVTQPLQRFRELDLETHSARLAVQEALTRTAQAYEPEMARSQAA